MLKAIWKTTRFEHAIILALAVMSAFWVMAGKIYLDNIIILAVVSAMFSEMGAFSINDYFDKESDKINNKETPLVKGEISERQVLILGLGSLILSTIFAALINIKSFMIILIVNLLSLLYNFKLKEYPLIGNLYIASTMALPFVFGNLVTGTPLNPVNEGFMYIALYAGLGREIIKTVEDVEGDIKARDAKTLPVVLGKERAAIVGKLMMLFAIIKAYETLQYLEIVGKVTLIISALIMGYSIIVRELKDARKISLLGMGMAIFSLLINIMML